MKRQLSEMTLKELWELFPIILCEHNPQYKHWYESEVQNLAEIVETGDIVRISHMGSTAVKGLLAKPTIDILLEINECSDSTQLKNNLLGDKWLLMSEKGNPFEMVFNKGYTPEGFAEKVFHLHVRNPGDWPELYFRDYLIEHSNIAKEYADLKQDLLKRYEYDRDAYTKAKSEFIQKYSNIARREYQDRYACG